MKYEASEAFLVDSPDTDHIPDDNANWFVPRKPHSCDVIDGIFRESHWVCFLGPPGVGKSALAMHFALNSRETQKYNGIFWINASNQIFLDQGFVELAHHLRLVDKDRIKIESIKRFVKQELDKRNNWLLIFDNLDDIRLVDGLLPERRGRRHILVTTRDQAVQKVVAGACVVLKPMNVEEATELYYKICECRPLEATSQDMSQLVACLNCTPLAIYIAVLYLHETKSGVGTYLETYRQIQESNLLFRPLLAHYNAQLPIAWTVIISLRQVGESKASLRLLVLLSFLYSDRIPEILWAADLRGRDDILGRIFGSPATTDRLLLPLLRFGLVKRSLSDDCILVNRMAQMLIRDIIAGEIDDKVDILSSFSDLEKTPVFWIRSVIKLVSTASQIGDSHEHSTRSDLLALNAISCIHFAQKFQFIIPELGVLYNWVATYMSEHAMYDQAHHFFEGVLWIQEEMFGVGHVNTAMTINELGIVYSHLGRFDKSVEYFERCRQITEKNLGLHHRDTAFAYDNLGLAYKSLSNYHDAIRNFRQALSIKSKAFDQEHTSVAETNAQLADMYSKLGNFRSAMVHFERALAAFAATLGREHERTAQVIEKLAQIYNNLGMYDEAAEFYNDVIEIQERLFGAHHVRTADTINNIGVMYRDMGKYDQAEDSFKSALSIYEKEVDVDDGKIANTINNIGMIWSQKGNHTEARNLLIRALGIKERVYGKGHIKTVDTIINLGVALEGLGRSGEALLQYDRVLKISERLPPLDVADLHNNVGITCWSLGQVEFARAHVFRSREIYVALLGERHPKSAKSNELLHLLRIGENEIGNQAKGV